MTDFIRKNLEKLLQDTGADMKRISTDVLGKNHSYLFGFLKRNSPAKLSFDSRLLLVEHFQVDPSLLLSPLEMKRSRILATPGAEDLFDDMCLRADQDPDKIAKDCGYNSAEDMRIILRSAKVLPAADIDFLLRKLAGRGDPPVTDAEIMQLAALKGFHPQAAPAQANSQPGFASAPYSGAWTGPDKIPVLAYAAASGERNAVNLENDIPIRWIERPHWLVGVVRAAAAQIMGDSMYPRYMDGDLVFINMSMPPVKGKDCIVNTKDGYTHIKQYLGQDKQNVRFHQYNPPQDITIHKRDIESMYAIVGRD